MGNCEKYLLKKCCGCGSLRTGTLIGAVSAIILSIIGIVVILLVPIDLKTIVLDWLDKDIVKIIIIINLCMTVLLSLIMIFGVLKRNFYLMIPWVVLGGMLAVGLLVSILMTSINLYINGDTTNGTLWLVLGLISLVVYCYMWYVAFSFFYEVRQETVRGAYTKDPFRRQY